MSTPETWTVRRVLEWTTGHLKKHGSDSPRLDAEILLAHARGCRRIQLYTDYDVELPEPIRTRMRGLVQRRAQREPVAYLVGFKEFFSLRFEVTPDVLIPRPDTETLIVDLLEQAKTLQKPRVLDLGTGSGCIAVTVAVHRPEALVTAVDVSSAALDVARKNAARHEVSERIRFVKGDLFGALEAGEPFDIIASNPPYIRNEEIEALQDDVRVHEPRLALDGGADGLDVIRRIVAEAPAHLAAGGGLLIEISPEQASTVAALFEQHRFTNIAVLKDLAGQARVVRGRLDGTGN